MLTLTASLLIQSYARMRTLRTGVETQGLVTAAVHLPDARYQTGSERARFYDQLIRRLKSVPGVSMVGATSALQLQSKGEGSMTWPEGAPIDPNHPPIVKNRNVSPDYFRVLGIPVVAGRGFTDADNATTPNVMLVNESFARRYFPGDQVLGRHVTYTSEHVTSQIIGVVADVRPRMTDAEPQPEMYFPYMQRSRHEMTIVLRARLPLATLERMMRSELHGVDPELPLYNVQTMDEVVSGVLKQPRSTMSIVAFFSAAALLLAAIGIYGVLSFTVSRRVREIGIRMALGAEAGDIRGMVVRQSLRMVLAGIALGIPASLALARFSSTLLFGISAGDPATVILVVGVISVVAWLAAYLPARRAARISPVQALQSE
jgi:putative ABC transport system permease protein